MAEKLTKTNDLEEEMSEFMEEIGVEVTPYSACRIPDMVNVNTIKDYTKRIVYLSDEITEDTMSIVNDLYRWDREDTLAGIKPEDRVPVIMFIANWGGDLITAYALISAMDAYKGRIATINQGVACSAAGLVFLCGTKGYRYCTKYSFTLLHQGSSGGGYGTYSQQEASQQNYTRMIDMMEDIVLSHTTMDPKAYKKTCRHENYYYAQDCVKLGICDKILTTMDEIWSDLDLKSVKAKTKTTVKEKKSGRK